MTRALIVTHGELGAGLLNAAAQIVGPFEGVDWMSNRGLGAPEMVQRIGDWLDREQTPALLLADFPGGSCHVSSMLALRSRPGRAILLSGANLMMLVTLLNKRTTLDGADLAEACLDSARRSISSKEVKP
jgi:mannose/fructose-specific phosphotransferase system component IIA